MNVLALVEAPTHVCCRYRIQAFAPALLRAGSQLDLKPIARGLASRLAQINLANRFDVTIVQRKLLPRWQVRWLRRSSRRLVFDFDDAVLFRDSYDVRGPFSSRRSSRFSQIVRLADTVIAGNDFLADCACKFGARPDRVRVIPTCINIDSYPPRTEAVSCVARGPRSLDLVWIGSSSTLQGLERKRGLWERVARELPGLRLRVICDRFPDLGPMPVVRVPWNEATEVNDLQVGDVGVSWIPDDLWSRGKCGLKILQYMAAGLPVLTNPVGVHSTLVAHGRTGWLATDDDAFLAGLHTLASDPDLRRRMAVAARGSVERYYSVDVRASDFINALEDHDPKGRDGNEVHSHVVGPISSRRWSWKIDQDIDSGLSGGIQTGRVRHS